MGAREPRGVRLQMGSLVTENFGQMFLDVFTILIKSIKHRLIIKLNTRMDEKSRDESIKSNDLVCKLRDESK